MSWFDDKKEVEAAKALRGALPDAMKNKTPEELRAIIEGASTAEARIAALEAEKAAATSAATAATTQFNEIKARLTSIEANGRPAPVKQDEGERANFIEDPDRAFNERAAPLANLTVASAAMTAQMLAQQELDNRDMQSGGRNHDGRLFRAWQGEIQAKAKTQPQTNLVYPNTWIDIFFLIKGQHADELRDPDARKKNYSFMEPASTEATRKEDNSGKPAVDQLTPQELKVAERMHVTPENYLMRKKKMQYIGA